MRVLIACEFSGAVRDAFRAMADQWGWLPCSDRAAA